jgi:hypothetical protein
MNDNTKIEIDMEKLSIERVENAKKRIAKILNMLQVTNQELKWACESQNWNEDVIYDIEDAGLKLGYALASLMTWDDEISD